MRVALWGFAGVIAIALGGCARDPSVTSEGSVQSGSWWIATQTDRITGAPVAGVSQTVLASNTYEDFPKPAILQMTCFDGAPLVRLAFEFKIGSDVNSVLGYRFDDKPGRDNVPGVRFLRQQRTVVIEEPAAVAQFVADMRGSRTLYIRARSITEGRTTAEFNLDGTDAAIEAAFKDCPLNRNPPSARPRRVS